MAQIPMATAVRSIAFGNVNGPAFFAITCCFVKMIKSIC